MTLTLRVLVFFSLCVLTMSCQKETGTRFVKLSADHSGVQFENKIEESPKVNIMTYEYTYNGGGVAAADFNNDGLCDLYFTGNLVSNGEKGRRFILLARNDDKMSLFELSDFDKENL